MERKPIFLSPIYKEKIWGKDKIKNIFNRNTSSNIGESWEISANENGDCIVENTNLTLSELFKNNKEIFGTNFSKFDTFPFIVKYIDANDNLSIQLHPNPNNIDAKTECWYILESEEDANIIYGLKQNINKKQMKDILNNNQIENYLNFVPVKKGDFIYIPTGLIHALLKGVFLIEIQQNSDTTYRLYDWNRKRELHIEKGIDNLLENQVMDTNFKNEKNGDLIHCEYFNIKKIKIENEYILNTNITSCELINIIDSNNGIMKIDNKTYPLKKGMSFILPAYNQEVKFIGNIELIKTWL